MIQSNGEVVFDYSLHKKEKENIKKSNIWHPFKQKEPFQICLHYNNAKLNK